ncbi:MAG: D-tyrosyl-tRNA(Tyr) deacylase [Actinobacteria bacterium]|nr:D-tyrosyl-tRNA(Tyr) deacylase [Actinomycetota bacterium]
MRVVVQRVTHAEVMVDDDVVGGIGPGLLAFVGVTHDDDDDTADRMADKLWHLRILADDDGRMNRSLSQVGGAVLVVSQFTLYGDTSRGRRPSWVDAAPPEQAGPLVDRVAERLAALGARVATGRFGAHMRVRLVNDGPVTLVLDASRPPARPRGRS